MSKQDDINFNKRNHLLYPAPKANAININTHNNMTHELVKAMVVYHLKKQGYESYSEASWGNGWKGIADIYVPEIPCYIEVLDSETAAKLIKKTATYPKITQVVVRVSDIIEGVETDDGMAWVMHPDKLAEILPSRRDA